MTKESGIALAVFMGLYVVAWNKGMSTVISDYMMLGAVFGFFAGRAEMYEELKRGDKLR